ncbi:MAG: T9SS type A sorting domain-containing protein [Bacteroidetes bacterium]|nr:T9SS type A sorting domain-containing protein [Bacteroidota bacterium]
MSVCHVRSICDYIVDPTGATDFYLNSAGCNTKEEVEAACDYSAIQEGSAPLIRLFPNPAKDFINISHTTEEGSMDVSIYNYLGQMELHKASDNNKIMVSTLRNGIYTVEITTNAKLYRDILIISR